MRRAEKQKKEAALEAKKKAKEEINAALDAEVARKRSEASAPADSSVIADNTNTVSE
jgi:hypothetical protein